MIMYPWMASYIMAIMFRYTRKVIITTPIGMVFAGAEKQEISHSVIQIINTIVAIVLVVICYLYHYRGDQCNLDHTCIKERNCKCAGSVCRSS